MKRARSVSNCGSADRLAFDHREMGGPDGLPRGAICGRRVAISAPNSGRCSVCTNILEKAGCAASACGRREHELGIGGEFDDRASGVRCW